MQKQENIVLDLYATEPKITHGIGRPSYFNSRPCNDII